MSHRGSGSIRGILERQSLYQIGYETAAGYLQLLRESSERDTVETALKSAECELRLQRGKEDESIQRVRSVLERSGLFDADVVLEEGEKYDESDQRQRVQALVLYNIAHQMYLEQWHYDCSEGMAMAMAKWIRRLVFDVRLASYNLADEKDMSSKDIALNYGVKLAKEMLNTLGRIDISQQVAKHESAICKYHIADIYFRCEDYPTSLELLKRATDQFKEFKCESETDRERYCIALWTLGNCHYRLKDFAKAEEQYDITIAEVKKLPATAAKWLKIVSEDLAKALWQQGKEPLALQTFRYGVSDGELIRRVNSGEGDDSLESLLDIASNELLLQRDREERSIQRFERKIFAEGTFTAASLLKKIEYCDVGYVKKRVKALILYQIAHKLFRRERHSVDDTVKWIQELVRDIQLSSYDLAAHRGALRTIAVNYGAKYADFLRNWLLDIENPTPSLLQMALAQCLYHIANIYFRAEDFQTSLRYFLETKRYSTEVFSESPRSIERYYLTIWNIGNCNFRLRNFDDAERSYRDAISGFKKANPNIEQRWLKIVERDHNKAVVRNIFDSSSPRSLDDDCSFVSEGNCFQVAIRANQDKNVVLERDANKYIVDNLKTIRASESFKSLSVSDFKKYLESCDLSPAMKLDLVETKFLATVNIKRGLDSQIRQIDLELVKLAAKLSAIYRSKYPTLTTYCHLLLKHNLSDLNCLELAVFATLYRLDELKVWAEYHVVANLNSILGNIFAKAYSLEDLSKFFEVSSIPKEMLDTLMSQNGSSYEKPDLQQIASERLPSQLRKLCPVRTKTIGPAGGEIELDGCRVTFPEGALKQDTDITMSVTTDPDKLPKAEFVITPVLRIEPSISFEKPVTVKMQTCFRACEGEKITAQLSTNRGSGWQFERQLELGCEYKIEFSVLHFSEDAVSINDNSEGVCCLKNSVFIQKKTGAITSVFCPFSTTERNIQRIMRARRCSIFSTQTLEVEGRNDDLIKLDVTLTRPLQNPPITLPYDSWRPKQTTLEKALRSRQGMFYFKAIPDNDVVDSFHSRVVGEYKVFIGSTIQEATSAWVAREWPVKLGPEILDPPRQQIVAGTIVMPEGVNHVSYQDSSTLVSGGGSGGRQ